MFRRATERGKECTAPAPASRHTMLLLGKLSRVPCAERNSELKNSSGGNIALILARMPPKRGGKSRQKPSRRLASTGGVPGPRKHPRTGKFETNCHAKIWCLESPDGEKVTARNLKVYMIDRYGEEEGKRVYGLLTCAAARFRKCGHGSGAGWRVLAVPALPGE